MITFSAKYKKTSADTVSDINNEAKTIASELQLESRIERFSEKNAFVTIKDHKENFPNNLKCRLINPAKSQIGIVSKQILEKINNTIRSQSNFNQWRNTSSVISWFNSIPNKSECKFLKFDIVDFYPTISEDILRAAITFAKSYVDIEDSDIYTILHSRKSLLFSADGVWIKHSGSLFDVTMGSYDGAEICELVGLFLLSKLSNIIHIDNIGLYRDDGLAIIRNASGPEMERTRKKVIAIFKTHGLKVTADTNLFQTDFLDATFDLNAGKFWPYRKPNDSPLYINTRPNHPPSITKQLPHMINNRIAQLSCDRESFNNAIPPYAEALRKAGHSPCTAYPMHPTTPPNRKKQITRKRNITWFNPPYNMEVKTNSGKKFFYLISKHFPPNNRLHKICNKFNVKLSYSCMPNMACIIKSHNNKLIYPTANTDEMPCNCRTKSECPLNGKCRIKSIVYKASITAPNIPTRHYFGLCETEFKARFYNHRSSFKDQRKMNATDRAGLRRGG